MWRAGGATAATRCQSTPGGEQIGRGGATAATLHAGAYIGGVVVVPVEDQRDSRFASQDVCRRRRPHAQFAAVAPAPWVAPSGSDDVLAKDRYGGQPLVIKR